MGKIVPYRPCKKAYGAAVFGALHKLNSLTPEQIELIKEIRVKEGNPASRKLYLKFHYGNNLDHYRAEAIKKNNKHSSYRKEYLNKNKERIAASRKKYNLEHRVESRDRQLKRDFGIDLKIYNEIIDSQRGGCAICGTTDPKGWGKGNSLSFRVDHDHSTGKVRGLLCCSCNFALGMLKDDSSLFRKAAEYLDFWKDKK